MDYFKEAEFKKHKIAKNSMQADFTLSNGMEVVLSYNIRKFDDEKKEYKHENDEFIHPPIVGNHDYKGNKLVNETYELVIYKEDGELFEYEYDKLMGSELSKDEINNILDNVSSNKSDIEEKIETQRKQNFLKKLGIEK